jgi:hypothetical protein
MKQRPNDYYAFKELYLCFAQLNDHNSKFLHWGLVFLQLAIVTLENSLLNAESHLLTRRDEILNSMKKDLERNLANNMELEFPATVEDLGGLGFDPDIASFLQKIAIDSKLAKLTV